MNSGAAQPDASGWGCGEVAVIRVQCGPSQGWQVGADCWQKPLVSLHVGLPIRLLKGPHHTKAASLKKKETQGDMGKLQCLLEPHLRSHTMSFSWCSWFHSFHSIWRRLPKGIRRQGSLGVLWEAGYQICVLSKQKQIQGSNLKWSHAGGTALHIWCLKYLEC